MTKPISIELVQLPHAQGLPLPAYETSGAAGMDIAAAIDAPISLAPMERAAVPTGLMMAIPQGMNMDKNHLLSGSMGVPPPDAQSGDDKRPTTSSVNM